MRSMSDGSVRLLFESSSMMVKAGIILGAVYVFISLLFPTIDLIYPRAVKDLVFMNFSKTVISMHSLIGSLPS